MVIVSHVCRGHLADTSIHAIMNGISYGTLKAGAKLIKDQFGHFDVSNAYGGRTGATARQLWGHRGIPAASNGHPGAQRSPSRPYSRSASQIP